MGIGERERQLREMKRITIRGCDKCKNFDNAAETQKRLATIRDFYDKLHSAGIFRGSRTDWIIKYNELIQLCESCTLKGRDGALCSGSTYAIELRNSLGEGIY
ncbi:TPA: hypothetical protein H1005_03135 [archaeon]|uniref:Uncharacterized protein n=1 Tax=Candidatus Naiadarchaeum limnaeum TaxID=2756139 RepID=A0A832XIM5_9ARCH|nr:hypothetical protein [Candidatus Naiadarchaeales archaeon SRR2090153.bin1042]HIK00966.1 hypothetical protein [Candidatus Naiadarchaeum limnaeum]